jgi:hypothetical protein
MPVSSCSENTGMIMRITTLFLLFAVAGCDQTDPYLREGVWRPNDANAVNLRAMVVVPADLVAATPSGPADGGLAVAAVDRLRRDHVRQLPDSGLAQIIPVSGAPTAQPGAASPVGTGN